MAKTLLPLPGETANIVPSLRSRRTNSSGIKACQEDSIIPNPTVVPPEILSGFHFTFLIRNPRRSIPSLYQCSTPPKSLITGWHGFKATDAGYREMRILFDYLLSIGQIGPDTGNEICIVDAGDLLAYPEETIRNFCTSVGIPFDYDALWWGTERDKKRAEDVFKNWAPFHDDVLKSTSLKATPPVCYLFLMNNNVLLR